MRASRPPALPFFVAACLGAVLLAAWGAEDPILFLGLPVAAGAVVLAYATYRAPERILAVTPVLILLADTKFRLRDATASLRGELDGQVMLELGLYALVGLVIAVVTMQRSVRPLPATMMEVLLVSVALAAFLSTVWSSSPKFTLVRATQLFTVYALARTLLTVLGPTATLRALAASLVPYVVVCSAIALAFPSTVLTWIEPGEINRFSWFGVWPTQAARFVALAALLLCADLLFERGSTRGVVLRVPDWLWIPPLGFLLLLTYSRTAIAAFGLAVCGMIAVKHLRLPRASALVAVSAVLALIFVNSGETLLDILQRGSESDSWLGKLVFRGQTADQFSRLSNRVPLWEGVWRLFLERPLLGYGYQGSRAYLLAIMPWAGHAHNALAQSLLDLGLVGAVPIALGLASCLSPRFLRAHGPASEVVGWRAGFFALGLFLLVASANAGSFAEPGFEALVFASCVLARERIRLATAARALRRSQPARRRSPGELEGGRVAPVASGRAPSVTPGERHWP
jgi:O-antigen ligase